MIYFHVNIPIIENDEIKKLKNYIYNQFIKDFYLKSELKRNSLKLILNKVYFEYLLTEKEKFNNDINLTYKNNNYDNHYIRYYFTILLEERDLIFNKNFLKKFYNKNILEKTLNKLRENLQFNSVNIIKYNNFYFENNINNFTEFSNKLLTFINDNLLEKNLFEIDINIQDFNHNVLFSINIMQDLSMNFFKLNIMVKYYDNFKKNDSDNTKYIRKYYLIANENNLFLSFNQKLIEHKSLNFYFIKYIKDRFIFLLNNLLTINDSKYYDKKMEVFNKSDIQNYFYKFSDDFYNLYFKEKIFIREFKDIYKFLFEDARLIEILL